MDWRRGFRPHGLVAVGGDIWVTRDRGPEWARLDGSPLGVVDVAELATVGHGGELAADGSVVWVGTPEGLVHVEPRSRRIERTALREPVEWVAAHSGVVWACCPYRSRLARYDPAGDVVATWFSIGSHVRLLLAGADGAWVLHQGSQYVVHADMDGVITKVALDGVPTAAAYAGDHLEVLYVGPGGRSSGLVALDPSNHELGRVLPLPLVFGPIVVVGEAAWLPDERWAGRDHQTGDLVRVGLRDGRVTSHADLGGKAHGLLSPRDRLICRVFAGSDVGDLVVAMHLADFSVEEPVDFSGIDVPDLPEPPDPHAAARAEARAGRLSADDVEVRVVEALRAYRVSDDVEIEQVGTTGTHPATLVEVLFRAPRKGDCLFGWRVPIWGAGPFEENIDLYAGWYPESELGIELLEDNGRSGRHQPDAATLLTSANTSRGYSADPLDLPYKAEAGGSSPSAPTELWERIGSTGEAIRSQTPD